MIHGDPAAGTFKLYYELCTGFDPKMPTIMIPADAQQTTSWVGYADKMKKLLGTSLNTVAFQHRGHFCSRIEGVRTVTDQDWARAYRIFRIDNVVEDMELIRRHLLGQEGKLLLWGCSGVATTAIQYLKRYHRHVPRALLGSFYLDPVGASEETVDYFVGFLRDRSLEAAWERIAREGRVDQLQLLHLVQQLLYADPERAAGLIEEVAAGDLGRFKEALKDPDRDAHRVIRSVHRKWPQAAVFMYESNVPTGRPGHLDINRPVLAMGAPLNRAARAGVIKPRRWDLSGLEQITTEVLLYGGSSDHVVPVSETRKIRERLPAGHLAVFHGLHCLADTGCKYGKGLADAFFSGGVASPGVRDVLRVGGCGGRFLALE